MARIIPGVEVKVIKEVVPPQLAPSGVLGIVGLVAPAREGTTRKRVERVASWGRFRELYRSASALAMPEVQQALQNGVYELAVVAVESQTAAVATLAFFDENADVEHPWLELAARVPGTACNGIEVRLRTLNFQGMIKHTLEVSRAGETIEVHRELSSDPDSERYFPAVLDARDSILEVLQAPTTSPELSLEGVLAGGTDATPDEYSSALALLEDQPDVDLVIASVQNLTLDRAPTIYGAVIAHCEQMSRDAKGRLGFGQIPVDLDDEQDKLVAALVSDRFVLFAPYGVLGAAVGRIASLPYHHSPTFKTLAGLGVLEPALGAVQQRAYLKDFIVPVAEVHGRGTVIVRGLTTDGDQINVRRVADRAVRGVKQIGERFIGKLNTETGRTALKQKITEFMLQMAADNAIVPSTDGSDPAFKLDVYSSQADFAKGIVRVDLALRPVRAIDFIYATVLVQV